MKKLILLGFAVLTIVSCERTAEMVAQPNEQEVLTNENFYKRESDTTEVGTFTTFDTGLDPGTGTEPTEGLDPKDITPPRR